MPCICAFEALAQGNRSDISQLAIFRVDSESLPQFVSAAALLPWEDVMGQSHGIEEGSGPPITPPEVEVNRRRKDRNSKHVMCRA